MVENSEKSCLVGLSDLSLKMGFMDMATNVEQSQSSPCTGYSGESAIKL